MSVDVGRGSDIAGNMLSLARAARGGGAASGGGRRLAEGSANGHQTLRKRIELMLSAIPLPEEPMTSVRRFCRAVAPLIVLLACRPESDSIVSGLLADRFANSEWSDPVNLGPVVNSSALDANAGLSSDAHTLFFVSTRTGGLGNLDIWMSHRRCLACDWEAPVNLGAPINSDAIDPAVLVPELSDPTTFDQKVAVSADGHELLLSSMRAGGFGNFDIWRFTRQSAQDPWSNPTHLDAPINTPDVDSQPLLSRDGRTLIFTSIRAGGHGAQDLWMSTRRPSPNS